MSLFLEPEKDDGYAAALNGEPMSACPYVPSDPEGKLWRQGWIQGESNRRLSEGTFGASDDEWAQAKALNAKLNPPDRAAEILGVTLINPGTPLGTPWLQTGSFASSMMSFSIDVDKFTRVMFDLKEATSKFQRIYTAGISTYRNGFQPTPMRGLDPITLWRDEKWKTSPTPRPWMAASDTRRETPGIAKPTELLNPAHRIAVIDKPYRFDLAKLSRVS